MVKKQSNIENENIKNSGSEKILGLLNPIVFYFSLPEDSSLDFVTDKRFIFYPDWCSSFGNRTESLTDGIAKNITTVIDSVRFLDCICIAYTNLGLAIQSNGITKRTESIILAIQPYNCFLKPKLKNHITDEYLRLILN